MQHVYMSGGSAYGLSSPSFSPCSDRTCGRGEQGGGGSSRPCQSTSASLTLHKQVSSLWSGREGGG
eukprot:361093-Chlamydomonas_euryale.AAC.2